MQNTSLRCKSWRNFIENLSILKIEMALTLQGKVCTSIGEDLVSLDVRSLLQVSASQ